mmetsp:Transcript_29275/g.55311  ORF Transcript_29275/g.55311 Transcript_29275/m.55311 type:complete len:210 (-) Transcript_29275:973-1602(-)
MPCLELTLGRAPFFALPSIAFSTSRPIVASVQCRQTRWRPSTLNQGGRGMFVGVQDWHTTRPQILQWCLRLVRVNFESQRMQVGANLSGTQIARTLIEEEFTLLMVFINLFMSLVCVAEEIGTERMSLRLWRQPGKVCWMMSTSSCRISVNVLPSLISVWSALYLALPARSRLKRPGSLALPATESVWSAYTRSAMCGMPSSSRGSEPM